MIYGMIIASLFVSLFILFETKGRALTAFYLKAFASFSFILVFGLAAFEKGAVLRSFDVLILLGLVMGMMGDLVLALRTLRPKEEDHGIILKGMIAFSLGHIFYVIALSTLEPIGGLSIILGFVMMGVVVLMSYLMKFSMGIVRIPSYLYALLIFMMIGQTIDLYITAGDIHQGYLMMMSGAILFGISDLILAPIYFKGMHSKWMISSNLVTYYLAQLLIAGSIYFF